MMKRIGTFAAIAFGWAAVLAAQAGQQPGQQPGRSGGPDDSRTSQTSQANTMTWTGCLERGSQATAGSSSGAPGAPASAQASAGASYILTDAMMSSGSGSTSSPGPAGTTGAGTPGAAGAAGASASGRTYSLEGNASEFTPLVNKRVQVTGTMASSSGASSSTPSTPGATSGAAGASAAATPRIKVANIKEVPGECK